MPREQQSFRLFFSTPPGQQINLLTALGSIGNSSSLMVLQFNFDTAFYCFG